MALFGLVIGYNASLEADTAALRYADDDAIKNARLLEDLGATYVVLTELDDETRVMYPRVETTRPTLSTIHASLGKLNGRIAEAKARGATTHLYLFYSGHGDVKNNEGYVTLADGPLWRTDLRAILEASAADVQHVIIDACKSYYLLFDRGVEGHRQPARAHFVVRSLVDDALDPTIGVLLSTSSAADSHEWERYRSGVFSHEVRSGMRGAADLDSDGRVSYEEIGAFIYAANRAIRNASLRPRFLVGEPSADEQGAPLPLVVLSRPSGSVLTVGPGVDQHLYIEDSFGERIADFHPHAAQRFALLLPTVRPLFVRDAAGTAELQVTSPTLGATVSLDKLTARPQPVAARGAGHLAFSRLFKLPYTPSSLTEVTEQPFLTPPRPGIWDLASRWGRPALGYGALALAAAGLLLSRQAYVEHRSVDHATSTIERRRVNKAIATYNTAAASFYGASLACLAAFSAWTILLRDDPTLHVAPAGGAAAVMSVGVRF